MRDYCLQLDRHGFGDNQSAFILKVPHDLSFHHPLVEAIREAICRVLLEQWDSTQYPNVVEGEKK